MKKILVCCVAFLFLAAFANAAVNVEIGGKVKKYPDGSILKIASKKKTTVRYSNFNVVIPRGNNFIMDCENDTITFKGKFDKPIQLNSYVIGTNFESNEFAVTTDGKVTVNEGSIEVTDAQNNVAIATTGGDGMQLTMPKEKFVDEQSDSRIYVTELEDVNDEINKTDYKNLLKQKRNMNSNWMMLRRLCLRVFSD